MWRRTSTLNLIGVRTKPCYYRRANADTELMWVLCPQSARLSGTLLGVLIRFVSVNFTCEQCAAGKDGSTGTILHGVVLVVRA